MKDLFVIGDYTAVETNCPYCRKPVRTYWHNEGRGMLSRPSVVLVDDAVFHGQCWDDLTMFNSVV